MLFMLRKRIMYWQKFLKSDKMNFKIWLLEDLVMEFVKYNKTKITSAVLSLAVLGITAFNAASFFTGSNFMRPSSVCVSKIDENHAKLHCDSVKTASSDFLFSKTKNYCNEYQYSITSTDGARELHSFSTPLDISLDEGYSRSSKLNVAAIAAAKGAGGLAIAGAGFAAASAAPAAVGVASGTAAAVGMGAAGIAATGTFSAGFWLGTSLVVAAMGPVAIIAGVGALGGAA
jgi:hypothetical protein